MRLERRARLSFFSLRPAWFHPNNIGHEEAVGCFRCHDGSHTAADGRTIKGDCDTCHILLAQDEKDPKILKDLGMK